MTSGLRARFTAVTAGVVLVLLLFWATWHIVYLRTDPWGLFRHWYVFALFLVFTVLPVWFALDHWIFRPLDRLTQANLRVAQGDLTEAMIPLGAIADDEVGAAIRARNEMLETLLRAQRRLDEDKQVLEERVSRRTFELKVVHELSERVGYTLSYDELARLTLEHLDRVVPSDVSAVLLVTDQQRGLALRQARPLAPAVEEEVRDHVAAGFARMTARATEQPKERLHARMIDSARFDASRAPMSRLGSVLQVPLLLGEEVAGLVFVGAEGGEAFEEEHRRVLSAIATQASHCLARLRTLRAVEHERLESLVARLPEAVILLDSDRRIVLANPSARAWLALLATTGVGERLASLGGQPLEALLSTGADDAPRELAVEGPRRITFEVVVRPVDAGPEEGGWVLVLRDVTRERSLAAEDRLAALGRLAAGVAHELRNPLTVIDGRLQLLRTQLAREDRVVSERLGRHAEGLAAAAERMKAIVHGLSTYSKPPREEFTLLDVPDLLAATRELVAYEARKRNVDIALEAPARIPAVLGDRARLMQVLLNLAMNAIEAMEVGGGRLTLSADVQPGEATALVRIRVADTGPGIPAATLDKIWEAFYTTKPEGTGLGLSIVRGLVAAQPGGSIGVGSEVGRGTTFTLTLPVAAR